MHGAVANRVSLEPLARALPPHVRLWAADLPGHGANARSRFTWDAALEQLRGLIRAAAGAPLVLAGDSLGGYLVLAAAAQASEPLAGVVAGGCTCAIRGASGALALASDVPVRALASLAGERRLAAAFARAFAVLTADPALAARVAAAGIRPRTRTDSLRELAGRELLPLVRQIASPVTFVNGSLDVPLVWGTRRYAAAAQLGRAVVIGGAGHAVSVLRPAAFAAEIVRYLRPPASGASAVCG